MGFSAIVCEFNPLHNGHKALIDYVKENFGGDVLLLMSGNFVERGEPAVLEKSIRARLAIESGGDIALELPVYFALSYAENFATGAISVLKKFGNVDRVVFGSECGDANTLSYLAKMSLDEPKALREKIKENLSNGLLFAKAREKAVEELFGKELSFHLTKPNNVLGIEYIKAIEKLGAKIRPVTVKRFENESRFSSSSKIRQALFDENTKKFLPENTIAALSDAIDFEKAKKTTLDLLRYKSLFAEKSELADIAEVSEGLENRIIKAIEKAKSFDELCEDIKSKRYTMAKIKRILLSFLIGIGSEDAKDAISSLSHVRALAVKKEKTRLLGAAENIAVVKGEKDMQKNAFLTLENKADGLYATICGLPPKKSGDGVIVV